MNYNFVPGIYRVKVLRLNVRGTKDWNQSGNLLPYKLTMGKEFPVYDVEIDDNGFPWGIITPPGAPQAHYVCMWDGNRLFVEMRNEFPNNNINKWVQEIDDWARSKGYTGQKPF